MQWGTPVGNKIVASDILVKMRLKLSDTQVNRYSDQELLAHVNESVSMIWRALAIHFSTITQRVAEYTIATGGVQLPDDYDTLVSIEDVVPPRKVTTTYGTHVQPNYTPPHIIGTTLFGSGHIRLTYNYWPKDLTRVDDVLDIPPALENDVVSVACNIAVTKQDDALRRAAEAAQRISQRREFAGLSQRVAFP